MHLTAHFTAPRGVTRRSLLALGACGALGVAARYGVGFSAELALTSMGKAQETVCACALLLIAAALILCAKLPAKRRS